MLQDKRLESILQITEEKGLVRTKELAAILGVSETTIRRDTEELEARKRLIRVHGGVKSLAHGSMVRRQNEKRMKDRDTAMEEKLRLCTYAAGLVQEGDTVFLDGGTTLVPLAHLLRNKRVLIVTNSELIMENFAKCEAQLFFLPGDYDPIYNMVTGHHTESMLRKLHFDWCFIGCLGLDLENGEVYTAEIPTASIKTTAIDQSSRSVLLADSTKARVKGFYTMGNIKDVDMVVMDKGIQEAAPDLPDNFVLV